MCLQSLHGDVRLLANKVVLCLGCIYLANKLLKLVEREGFVELDANVQLLPLPPLPSLALPCRLGLLPLYDVVYGCFEDVALACLCYFVEQLSIFGLERADLV